MHTINRNIVSLHQSLVLAVSFHIFLELESILIDYKQILGEEFHCMQFLREPNYRLVTSFTLFLTFVTRTLHRFTLSLLHIKDLSILRRSVILLVQAN